MPNPVQAPALRRSDEARLLAEYAADPSPRVLDELVRSYRPLARSLALRYRASSEPLDDLVQVANLGLVKAIKGFDPAKGKPFTAYAVPTILGELKRHFRDRIWNLRLPRSLQESTMKVEEATERLTERLGRSPTVAELAEATDLEADSVLDTLRAADARHRSRSTAPSIATTTRTGRSRASARPSSASTASRPITPARSPRSRSASGRSSSSASRTG